VQSVVEMTVACQRESMAHHLAARALHRGRSGV
jgi:hypothetical protein